MPTLVGPVGGGAIQSRLELDYSVSYNADRTQALVNAWVVFASSRSIYDSTNSWEVWGQLGSSSGSNLGINHGGSGGRTGFSNVAGWVNGTAGVGARVTRLEAVGTVEAVFYVDVGPLAPYTDSNYSARDVTATSFTSQGINANGNGGSLVDIQMQVNTSPNDGGVIAQGGSFKDVTVGGLVRNTTYYFRIRVANNTYGWGPWGAWRTVATLTSTPGAVVDSWSIRDITQVSAFTTGLNVADNGGLAISNYQVIWYPNTPIDPSMAYQNQSGSGSKDPFLSPLLPGTLYYTAIRAGNARGWGPWSGWKTFRTLPGVYVKVGGVWKMAIPYVKYQGAWKLAIRYVKVNGTWRQ